MDPGRSWGVCAAPFGRIPPEPELLRLDRSTHQAVTRGYVDTTGDPADGGTWVRLLRAVILELARFSPDEPPRGAGIAEIRDAMGRVPPAAALRSYPYEVWPPRHKLVWMRAAAFAVDRARSLLTDWMEGNGPAIIDPRADTLRRQWIGR